MVETAAGGSDAGGSDAGGSDAGKLNIGESRSGGSNIGGLKTGEMIGPGATPSRGEIIGHGIDLVEVARIKRLVHDHGQRFLDRCFTPMEQQYCNDHKKRYFEHVAGRFAAKEAILKALGTGWRGAIAWTDMEILNDERGKPELTLSGECLHVAARQSIARWLISISHTETHAMASALCTR